MIFKCRECGEYLDIPMTRKDYEEYTTRQRKIQDIFPDMSIENREFLLTEECPKCQEQLFNPFKE